jgi:hypothetical protein
MYMHVRPCAYLAQILPIHFLKSISSSLTHSEGPNSLLRHACCIYIVQPTVPAGAVNCRTCLLAALYGAGESYLMGWH